MELSSGSDNRAPQKTWVSRLVSAWWGSFFERKPSARRVIRISDPLAVPK